jgi:hypothetical protein
VNDRQTHVAEITQTAADGSGLFVVPVEHRKAVLEGLGQAEFGELATEDEMKALWSKCGL